MHILKFCNFRQLANFYKYTMNHILSMYPSKLRTSQGHNEPKKWKIDQFLLGKLGNLLYTLNGWTPCTSISNEFLWLPIFTLEVYILILNLNLTTCCVGIVVRTLDCHQGDPSSNPSTAKPFCEKLCLENSLKIWLSQIWDKFELHLK